MGKQKATAPGAALAEQLARRQRTAAVQKAKQKLEAGQDLTSRELAELRKWEAEQTERFGRQYIKAMPKADYADYSGRQPKQLIEAAQRYGFPYPQGRKDPVDVGVVIRWFHDFLAANAGMLASVTPEDAVLQLASPKLKDELVRACIENKHLDNDKRRIENAKLAEDCVPVEPMRQLLNYVADRARKVRDKLQLRLTGDALEQADRLYVDMIDDIERYVDDHFNANDFENYEANTAGREDADAMDSDTTS